MAMDSIKARARSGALWGAGSQAWSLVLQLIQSIVVARLLGPEKYAEIAVIYVVAAIAVPFAQSGLGVAIIYFRERDPKRIAQLQTLSVLIASAAAGVVYAIADPVARYFRLEDASLLIKLSAATIWFSAISSVWQSQLKRNLIFREIEVAYLMSYTVGFGVVMGAVYGGFESASVVIGQVCAAALNALFLQIALHKRKLACGLAIPGPGILPHLGYGGMNTFSAVASVLSDRVDAMVIGGRLSAVAFGAYGLFARIITALSTPIQRIKTSIEFPTYAHIAGEKPKFRRAFAKALALTGLIIFPVFVGLALVSDLALRVALGPQWAAYDAVLAVMSIYGLLRILSSSSTPLFMAAGLVRRAVYLVFARLAIMPVLVVATLAVNPTLVAVAVVVTATQAAVIVANYLMFVRPVLGPCAAQIAGVTARPLAAALLMAAAVAAARRWIETPSDLAELAMSVGVGALAYAAGNLIFNRGALKECLYMVRPLIVAVPGARPLFRIAD